MKTGLVMEGGAMRGMFTAGVTDVLMENGITFDGAIGVSAGACFGCNYKSRQPGRAIRYNLAYCRDPRYCSLRSLLRTGDLYGVEFCYRTLPQMLDVFDLDAYRSNPMDFYVVCTDVETGEPVYHRCEDGGEADLDWIRASASMPLVSRVVPKDGYKLLDGGISDSIPLKAFEEMGFERNVVILTQPRSFVKQKAHGLSLLRTLMRRYPPVCRAMKNRHIAYNAAADYVRRQEEAGFALVIAPAEALPVSRIEHHADRLKAAYDIGRKTAEERLNEVRAFLAQ